MKKFYSLLVVLMLFVFPIGSYYYLQTGYDYRLQALTEIEEKSNIDLNLADGSMLVNLLKNKVSVLTHDHLSDSQLQEVNARLHEQFGMNDQFQFLRLGNLSKADSLATYSNFRVIDQVGLNNIFADKTDFVLTDIEGFKRSSYKYQLEDMQKLVKHVSILLPLPKRDKVTLKRDLEDNE